MMTEQDIDSRIYWCRCAVALGWLESAYTYTDWGDQSNHRLWLDNAVSIARNELRRTLAEYRDANPTLELPEVDDAFGAKEIVDEYEAEEREKQRERWEREALTRPAGVIKSGAICDVCGCEPDIDKFTVDDETGETLCLSCLARKANGTAEGYTTK